MARQKSLQTIEASPMEVKNKLSLDPPMGGSLLLWEKMLPLFPWQRARPFIVPAPGTKEFLKGDILTLLGRVTF